MYLQCECLSCVLILQRDLNFSGFCMDVSLWKLTCLLGLDNCEGFCMLFVISAMHPECEFWGYVSSISPRDLNFFWVMCCEGFVCLRAESGWFAGASIFFGSRKFCNVPEIWGLELCFYVLEGFEVFWVMCELIIVKVFGMLEGRVRLVSAGACIFFPSLCKFCNVPTLWVLELCFDHVEAFEDFWVMYGLIIVKVLYQLCWLWNLL